MGNKNTVFLDLDLFEEFDDEFNNEDNKIQYSNWVYNKSSYSPAIDVEIVKKVEPGVYKINNDFNMIPQNINSDNLYLFSESKMNDILTEVNIFLNRKDYFKKANLIHKRGILLVGPPGTGKSSIITLLTKNIIKDHNGVIFLVNNISDFTKIFEFLKGTFRKIEPDTFVVTIIEDIDKICRNNIEPEILDFFDGKSSINHHLIITTSNDTSDLPDALVRPSRIDKTFYIGYLDEKSRREFFINKNVDESLLETYVENSKDMTISELKELYIGTYVMGNPFEEVVNYILSPFEKKEYGIKNDSNNQIEID